MIYIYCNEKLTLFFFYNFDIKLNGKKDENYNGNNGFRGLDTSIEVVTSKGQMASQPVTYTWENIEVETNVVQGNCRNKQVTKKRILDNGKKTNLEQNIRWHYY